MMESSQTWAIILPVLDNIQAAIDATAQALRPESREAPDTQRRRLEALNRRLLASLSELRVSLSLLEGRAATSATPATAYMHFALVCSVDEKVLRMLDGRPTSWPLLQKELLRTDDGGEHFYVELDQALSDPVAPSVVFEVFLYCLERGFKGMFEQMPAEIGKRKEQLRLRIDGPSEEVLTRRGEDPPASASGRRGAPDQGLDLPQTFPWRTWAVAALLVVAIHVAIVLSWRM